MKCRSRDIYIDFNKENDKEDPKLEVGNHVRISKYENMFQKVTIQVRVKKFL